MPNAEAVLNDLISRVSNAMEKVDAMQAELRGIAKSLFEFRESLGGERV